VLAGLLVVGLKYTNTAPKEEQVTNEPGVAAPVLPKTVKFRRETRQRALNVAADFVGTAVVRKHLAHAWKITGANVKQGQSFKEWMTGDISVVPYPVDFAKWKLDYSYANEVGLKVALFPKRGSKLKAAVFDLDVKHIGPSDGGRWLVDYFGPSAARFAGSRTGGGGSGTTLGVAAIDLPEDGTKGRLSATWLVLPLGILGLIVIIPLAIGLGNWYRNARAYRAYLRNR
jgi:hypothetical protein